MSNEFVDDFSKDDVGHLSLDYVKKAKRRIADADLESWQQIPRRHTVRTAADAYDRKARCNVPSQYPYATYYFFGSPLAADTGEFDYTQPLDDPLYVAYNFMDTKRSPRMNFASALNGEENYPPYAISTPMVKDRFKDDPLLGFYADTSTGRPIPKKGVLTPIIYIDPICDESCPGKPEYKASEKSNDRGEWTEFEIVKYGNHSNPVCEHIPENPPELAFLHMDSVEFKAFIAEIKRQSDLRGEKWDITGVPISITKDTSTKPKGVNVMGLDVMKWQVLPTIKPTDFGMPIDPQDYLIDARTEFVNWCKTAQVPYVSEDTRKGATVAPWDAGEATPEPTVEQIEEQLKNPDSETAPVEAETEDADLEALRKRATELEIGWTAKTPIATLKRRVNKAEATASA